MDREHFDFKEHNGLRLYTPKHEVGNIGWTRDTIQYRSRVEDFNGNVISQGFKKFFNLGTGPLDLQIGVEDVIKSLGKGAVATLKMDGSLLIRSVYQNKVMLRTRGSLTYEHLDNAHEMEQFFKQYPKLFNPTFYGAGGISLLFEWTTPNNIIVLKYAEPKLTLIGAITHNTLHYTSVYTLKWMADHMGVPVVDHFNLDAHGWDKMQAQLESNQDIEGYVIRLHGEQDLVKVKCQPYLTKHGLKSTLTTDKLADMYLQQGRPDFEGFCSNFVKDFDEETFMWAIGAISNLYDGVRELNAIESHMSAKAHLRKDWTRKDVAIAGQHEYGVTKRFAAFMNLWEGKAIEPKLLKSILLQSTKQVEISMIKPTNSYGVSSDDVQFEIQQARQ